MANVDVIRSTKFVSLDTHPANNALVLTYEIIVSIVDRSTCRELSCRSKRAQLQVNIAALDKLSAEDFKTERLVINLNELSSEILAKCPLLQGESANNNILEDIQLHLLYLINRRQSQLLAQKQPVGSSADSSRPPSSASVRLRSAQRLGSSSGDGLRSRNGISSSASSRKSRNLRVAMANDSAAANADGSSDVYSCLLSKELSGQWGPNSCCGPKAVELFLDELDEHLGAAEEQSGGVQLALANSPISIQQLDNYLEGLYGERKEKEICMALIRRLMAAGEKQTAQVSSNKLLVCAMLRTLRDSEIQDFALTGSILYCLIKFTSFEDISTQVFPSDDSSNSLDLVRLLTDQLANYVRYQKLERTEVGRSSANLYYHINSLLAILINLFELSSQSVWHSQRRFIAQEGKTLLAILRDLLQLGSKQLAREMKLLGKPERSLTTLTRTMLVLRHLSILKEFIILCRGESDLFGSLINLLNVLQLSRPGSGAVAQSDLVVVNDKRILQALYELELESLKLINNLIIDHKLKGKLIKRNLLKCLLRNLVVFLASRKRSLDTLEPFDGSPVLIIPFKCLYELSCDHSVRLELYRSKIITKCLLEFLLCATMDLKRRLELAHKRPAERKGPARQADELAEIVLEADSAAHYIISLWVNLSAKKAAPIYADDLEIKELLCEYIDLALTNLRAHLMNSNENGQRMKEEHSLTLTVMVYAHMKLLRNFTQFLNPHQLANRAAQSVAAESYANTWIRHLGEAGNDLLAGLCGEFAPLAVECLAALTNLVNRSTCLENNTNEQSCQLAANLVSNLFKLYMEANEAFDAENDDLLLVAILLIESLARKFEICNALPAVETICLVRIIDASNSILESKSTDHEMLIAVLLMLNQLLNHSGILKALLVAGFAALEPLVDKLTSLMLHANVRLAKLAVLLLNRLRQFEELNSIDQSTIYEHRFVKYNTKWLSAMKASQEELLAGGFAEMQRFGGEEMAGNFTDIQHEDLFDSKLVEDDDFNQLRAFDERQTIGPRSSLGDHHHQREGEEIEDIEVDKNDAAADDGGEEDDDEDEEDDDDDDLSFSAPDMNVIDANSMIKHLTSRREFRNKWLRR